MNYLVRRVRGFLQRQGFFPHPIHNPVAFRFPDFIIDGVSEINFVQCLNLRFGLSSTVIFFSVRDVIVL